MSWNFEKLAGLYKSFIQPHLDYAGIIYDEPNKINLCSKIDTCQFNVALAVTGAIRGSLRKRLHQELGFEH